MILRILHDLENIAHDVEEEQVNGEASCTIILTGRLREFRVGTHNLSDESQTPSIFLNILAPQELLEDSYSVSLNAKRAVKPLLPTLVPSPFFKVL